MRMRRLPWKSGHVMNKLQIYISFLLIASCSSLEPDDDPQHHCNEDKDCKSVDPDSPFLVPANATCRVNPTGGFRECSECHTSAECPSGAYCHVAFQCRYPNFAQPDTGVVEDVGGHAGEQ